MFDKDNSGYISYDEFRDLCKYMGLCLNQEEGLKLFALANTNDNEYIDYYEFQNAIFLIKGKIALDTLVQLGVTTADLIIYGVSIMLLLVLVMVFIFLGIFAFSKAEGFNSVVNSILPLIAGIAAGTRTIDMKEKIDSAKKFIKEMIAEFQRKLDN